MEGETTKKAAPSTEELLNKIAELEAIITEQAEYIASLESKAASPTPAKPIVKIGKKVYEVNFGILHNQVKYSAAELAQNIALCKEVIETEGQTHLTLLED